MGCLFRGCVSEGTEVIDTLVDLVTIVTIEPPIFVSVPKNLTLLSTFSPLSLLPLFHNPGMNTGQEHVKLGSSTPSGWTAYLTLPVFMVLCLETDKVWAQHSCSASQCLHHFFCLPFFFLEIHDGYTSQ